jgi:hypothetical protein
MFGKFKRAPLKRAFRRSASAVYHTGDTREVTLGTITLPPNAMGEHGRVLIEGRISYTNSSNIKILRIKFGGVTYLEGSTTSTNWWRFEVKVTNQRQSDVQEGSGFALLSNGALVRSRDAASCSAVNTRESVDITITGELTDPREKVELEVCQVIVHPK